MVSDEWQVVLEDLQRMAKMEGALMQVMESMMGLVGNPRYMISSRPLEDDLRWLVVKKGKGRRAVYQGRKPCHMGMHWPWVSFGDAGSTDGVTYTAMVTDMGRQGR